ncbi:MAG: hypothetical protein RLZZ393_58 [Pseudomonadota bacterium]
MNRMAACLALLVALVPSTGVFAADPGDVRKVLTIPRLEHPPVIDGRVEEPLWATAAKIDDLRQIRPHVGEPGTEKSEILVAYDADALYVAARFWDGGGRDAIAANIMRQGSRLAEDDRIAIILDPFDSSRTGYRFEVNLNSVRNDMLYTGPTAFTADWTVIWDAKAQRTDYGWSLELAIPFKTLPFDPSVEAWGFNVSRAIRRKGEEDLWVSRNRTWGPAVLGEIRGIKGVDQGIGLDVVPSVGLRHLKNYSADSHATVLESSLDAYYRVTPSLNASLTLNTDFSATELDDRQVNLTRFGLFFPEKRDFFLNDADVFEFGRIGSGSVLANNRSTTRASQESGRPFFSRRIGLSSAGTPVDITLGGKLSGRVDRFRVGALAVRQGEYRPATGAAVQAADLGVLRVSADILAESSVGFIATSGDPATAGSASLYGADFLFLDTKLPGGRSIEAEGWFQDSQAPGAGAGGTSAWGVGLRMPNAEGLRFGLGTKEVGAQFRPALGFVSRRGVRGSTADIGYTRIVHADRVQSWYTGLDAERIEGLDGTLQTQVVALRPLELETRGRDILRVVAMRSEENLATPFTIYQDVHRRVAVPVGRYAYSDYGFDLETGSQREWSGHLSYRKGDFYDGTRLSLGGDVTWRPSRHLGLKAAYSFNDIALEGGAFSTRVLAASADIVFSSTLSWITLMQYDNVSETAGFQSRLVWVPRAGQKYFIVANHGFQDADKDGRFRSTSTEISLRAGYTWRF